MIIRHWLVVEPPTPLKNDGVSNSCDDYYSQYDGKVIIQPCSGHHQPDQI